MTRLVRVAALTDRGLVRDHNEDAVLIGDWISQASRGSITVMEVVQQAPLLLGVADGMGGHAAGDLASRTLLADLRDHAPEWTDRDSLTAGIASAGKRLAALGADPRLAGLGTTVAGVLVGIDEVTVFNVGDSRVYQVVDGYLDQVSIDDCLTGFDGQPTGILTQSLGDDNSEPEPHLYELDASFEGRLLILSDGVTGPVDRRTLRRAASLTDPRHVATALAAATLRGGADDNYSIVIIELISLPTQLSATEVSSGDPEIESATAQTREWRQSDGERQKLPSAPLGVENAEPHLVAPNRSMNPNSRTQQTGERRDE